MNWAPLPYIRCPHPYAHMGRFALWNTMRIAHAPRVLFAFSRQFSVSALIINIVHTHANAHDMPDCQEVNSHIYL